MKKILFPFMIVLLFHAHAAFITTVEHPVKWFQEGNSKYWSAVSGVNIEKYYTSSFVAKLEMNDTQRQYVSLGEVFMDMQEYGLDNHSIQAYDMSTGTYKKVKTLFFVLNANIPVAFIRPTSLAFSKKADAVEFMKQYKGSLMTFDEALHYVQTHIDEEMLRLKHYRKKKVYKKGQRIFKKRCDASIDALDYIEINELKGDLKQTCKSLDESYLQAVALYLWEVKRKIDMGEVEDAVKVEPHEKCPVCGMFTYKYPKWAAQIFYKHKNKEHHFSFDGVKDMMKFYFEPLKWGNYETSVQKNIQKILVTDYYSQRGIDAKKAYYVIGSDVFGPMGHELIPFESLREAKTFKSDHRGKEVLKFEEITLKKVEALDEP